MGADGNAFLETLGVFLVAAAVCVVLARVIRMPTIPAYIAAGLGIGPLLGLVNVHLAPQALETVADMGIVLLMFLVGLELSLARIRQVGKVALAAGIGQVVFTAAGGFGLGLLLGFERIEAIFIATALTFSSTIVVVKLLDQKGELGSLYGRIAVGIFLVQDLVVVVVLTVLAGLGQASSLDAGDLALALVRAFGGMAVLLAVALVAARFLLPRFLRLVQPPPRTQFIWSLSWCFLFVLAATTFGLSAEIGAFLAGLSVAQLRPAKDLRRRAHPLMTVFMVVFFVALGAQMQPGEARAYWFEAIVLSLFVLVGNPVIFMAIIARYGYSQRTCSLTSVTVAQISEFSFIFAAMGISAGLIAPPILAVIAIVGVVTISMSAYMILYNDRLYALLEPTRILRIFRAPATGEEEAPPEQLEGHVVVVGMNDLGRRLVRELRARGERVVALDRDAKKLRGLRCKRLVGDVDYVSTLEEAGVPSARLAISALRIESTNKLFAYRCKTWGVPSVLYAFDQPMLRQLQRLGADYIVEAKREAGVRVARELQRAGAVGES